MTTTTSKRFCTTCNKERGIFKCDGCSQLFCLQHTTDHHQDVIKQLDEVDKIRNLAQKALVQESFEPQRNMNALYDELVGKIDKWERESISVIQKLAEEARNELTQLTTGRLLKMQGRLEQIANEVQEARKNNDFIETDIRNWEKKLNEFKDEIQNPPMITVREDYAKIIPKIRVGHINNQEAFERSSGNVEFEENGQVVYLKNAADIYTEVRGQREYTTGQHTISLNIEQVSGWILFGIISKSSPLQVHSYIAESCYGWYNGEDFNYAAGQVIAGPGNNVIEHDTVQLIIDCDERVIRFINERIKQTLEMQVDITKCPFPWQLHLNLNQPPTRIRLFSSLDS